MTRVEIVMSENRCEERIPIIFENEGKKIFGVLHRPLSEKPVPVVVMCHGFAGNRIGKYRIYVLLAQRLAQMNIATLRFDFRGSGESEGDFADMTLETELSDALKALAFVRTCEGIDLHRIGLLGNSFGSAVAVLAAQKDLQENLPIKSLALLAPLFNSKSWLQKWEALKKGDPKDEGAQQELSRVLDGNVPGSAFYPSFFKLNLKKPLEALLHLPFILAYSERDERISEEQIELFKESRYHAHAETEWVALQKSDHVFSHAEERFMMVEKIAQWFSKTL
jgi:alpha/beta superfamily hydrolase